MHELRQALATCVSKRDIAGAAECLMQSQEGAGFVEGFIRSLLDSAKTIPATLEILEILLKNDRLDLISPIALLEIFKARQGTDGREILLNCVGEKLPSAKFARIIKSLADVTHGYQLHEIKPPKNLTYEKTIVEAHPLNTNPHPSIAKLNHPLRPWVNRPTAEQRPNIDIKYREFENVYIFILDAGFVILDENLNPTGMHSLYITPKLLKAIEEKAQQGFIKIKALSFCGDKFGPNNYCHFVVDYLPQIMWLQEYSSCPQFGILNLAMTKFQKSYFKLIGLPENNIRSMRANTLYKIDKLCVLSSAGTDFKHVFQSGNPDYAKPVLGLPDNQSLRADPSSRAKKIAFTRPTNLGRNFTNDAEIFMALKQHGFVFVDPGSLPVSQQINLMQTANCVFSIHGAALTNTVFCKPKTQVIEVLPPLYGTPAFSTIANTAGLEYCALMGTSQDRALSRAAAGRYNFKLPLDILMPALR